MSYSVTRRVSAVEGTRADGRVVRGTGGVAGLVYPGRSRVPAKVDHAIPGTLLAVYRPPGYWVLSSSHLPGYWVLPPSHLPGFLSPEPSLPGFLSPETARVPQPGDCPATPERPGPLYRA